MATNTSNSIYTFVKDLPEDFTCPVCLDAIYDAKQTDCCGHHLCKACTDRLVASTDACPQCRTSPLATHDDLFMRRKLKQLHIYCTNRQDSNIMDNYLYPTEPGRLPKYMIGMLIKGCEWSGEINDLQEHLDKQCPHGPVTCQYRCGTKLLRCQQKLHETRQCVKRPFKCWYCGMEATAMKIDHHGPTCDRRPTKCPNKCPATLVLGQVQDHLKQCPLQEVSCEFEHAGCSKKVLYKDYDSHLKEDSLSHQRLLSTALAAQAKQAEELKQSVTELKTRMKILSKLHIDNIRITLGDTLGSASPDFYINGYCMYVQYSSSEVFGSCTCLTLVIKPGKYDDDLQWPLTGEITLILLHPTDPQKNMELEYQIENVPKDECVCIKYKKYIYLSPYNMNRKCNLVVKKARVM